MDKRAIKFLLSGRTAMFKKPDVNAYAYFSYNNIHKIALLGLLGSVIGLGGYGQQKGEYPEFYEVLHNLKIAIIPDLQRKGVFTKKIQAFNNSVGYASFEEGGNLIVKEQWLEEPSWEIYLLDDGSSVYNQIKEYLSQGKSVFIPYLGKNDHPAIITYIDEMDLLETDTVFIDSLVVQRKIVLGDMTKGKRAAAFIFKEAVPVRMNQEYNFYEFAESCLTNLDYTELSKDSLVYSDGYYTLFFF